MRLPRLSSRLARPFFSFRPRWRSIRAEAAALVAAGQPSQPDRPGAASSPDKSSESTGAVRVLLVDDHVLVRAGVRTLLEEQHAFQIVGEAREGIEALDLMAQAAPRVAVMDLIMPGLGGLETTHQIRERFPDTSVVILSMYCDEEQVQYALAAGARGFVRKGAEVGRLAEAIRKVAEG